MQVPVQRNPDRLFVVGFRAAGGARMYNVGGAVLAEALESFEEQNGI